MIKKILVYITLGLIFFGLIQYCAYSVDKARAEKRERSRKLEAGVCEFDKIDLENFFIKDGKRTFKSVLDLDTLKTNFSEYMGKLNVDDTSSSLKSFKIGNTLFTFYQRGKLAAINSIRMDFSSQFTFNLNDKLIFSPEFKLGDFEENFSKSFSCGEVIATSLIDEQSALRIDNSVESSRLKFIILYFNHAENLSNVGFYYEGFNI